MAGNGPNSQVNTLQLIAIPALITLAITIIRLIGEMQGWSKVWFNPQPGGGAAPIEKESRIVRETRGPDGASTALALSQGLAELCREIAGVRVPPRAAVGGRR